MHTPSFIQLDCPLCICAVCAFCSFLENQLNNLKKTAHTEGKPNALNRKNRNQPTTDKCNGIKHAMHESQHARSSADANFQWRIYVCN